MFVILALRKINMMPILYLEMMTLTSKKMDVSFKPDKSSLDVWPKNWHPVWSTCAYNLSNANITYPFFGCFSCLQYKLSERINIIQILYLKMMLLTSKANRMLDLGQTKYREFSKSLSWNPPYGVLRKVTILTKSK